MKKTLIALAAFGAAVSVHATNVTVYGVADVGFIDGPNSDVSMGENVYSRLGVKGSEDLGNGLKAIFQLEQRMQLATGASTDSTTDFLGAANVGLVGSFGEVRFGHVDELSSETTRRLDPFQLCGVAAAFTSSNRADVLSNTARWTSPVMSGLKFGASYTLNTADLSSPLATDDDGYALSGTYTNGALYAAVNYNQVSNYDGDNWNVGASYIVGDVTLSALYEKSTSAGMGGRDQKTWLLGASWKVGNGVVKASYNDNLLTRVSDNAELTDANQFALGYQYNLSKRTSAYIDVANRNYESADNDEGTHVNIGMTHLF